LKHTKSHINLSYDALSQYNYPAWTSLTTQPYPEVAKVLYEPRTTNQMQRNTSHTSATFQDGHHHAEELVNREPKVKGIRPMTPFFVEYVSE
jgi:hypothetical protein